MLKAAPRAPPNATENVYVSINRVQLNQSAFLHLSQNKEILFIYCLSGNTLQLKTENTLPRKIKVTTSRNLF